MRSKYHRSDPETLSGIFFGVSDGISPTNDGISPANMGSIMGIHGVKKRSGPRKMRFIGEDGDWVRDRVGDAVFFLMFFLQKWNYGGGSKPMTFHNGSSPSAVSDRNGDSDFRNLELLSAERRIGERDFEI
jgi:hypothetical protein